MGLTPQQMLFARAGVLLLAAAVQLTSARAVIQLYLDTTLTAWHQLKHGVIGGWPAVVVSLLAAARFLFCVAKGLGSVCHTAWHGGLGVVAGKCMGRRGGAPACGFWVVGLRYRQADGIAGISSVNMLEERCSHSCCTMPELRAARSPCGACARKPHPW